MSLERFEAMDTFILLSMVNMKLRDEFSDIDSLVKFYDIDKEKLVNKLAQAGFEYLEDTGQFR
ncbi:DUF4250 domain-containing protein [Vibrio ostreicida]|uniref:DUF4250 domain-containing protein n=1 Tax=Vibrio ostreicida TaxID=526588 RepID=A0ABT8BVC6_9VIBR|nr:DUF4250 domain-containing protein [Vibrio ostreicida]MDN3610737.1 DUF4250 domain-containing protein [Vibrio ostreicida]NPD07265.1 DUF4250 domain-containing protein [Vibrio ostreicida]